MARFATFCDGSFIAPLRSFERHEARLRRDPRAMSGKVKGSNNWRKAKARVQRVHARIGHVRADFLHKASTAIARERARVCIEDLAVRNMSRSASGTVDAPGRHVRAKSGVRQRHHGGLRGGPTGYRLFVRTDGGGANSQAARSSATVVIKVMGSSGDSSRPRPR